MEYPIVTGELSPLNTISGNINAEYVSGGVNAPSGIGRLIPDDSLSLSGRAADAKTVGDKFALIDEKINDLETEVGDASILLSLI